MSNTSTTTVERGLAWRYLSRLPDLPAVLMKEFREELRARTFVHSTIWFHVVLLVLTFFSIAEDSPTRSSINSMNGLFWGIVALPLLVIIPLRATGALSKELAANEFELLFLTPLSGTQLVFQKWLALCLQGSLYLTAALPYAVVRYFLFYLNAESAILFIAQLIFWMLVLTAFGVSFSSWRTGRSRGSPVMIVLLLLVAFPLGNFVLALLYTVFSGAAGGILGAKSTRDTLFLMVAFGPLAIAYLLEVAASNVAPASENHAIRKRAIAILILMAMPCLHYASVQKEFLLAVGFALLTPIAIGALSEPPQPLLTIYAPIRRYPRRLRWICRLFYPGWLSGSRFILLFVVGPTALTLLAIASTTKTEAVACVLWLLGALYLPVIVTNCLAAMKPRRLTWYLVSQLLFTAFGMLAAAILTSRRIAVDVGSVIISALPHAGLGALIFENSRFEPSLIVASISTAALLAIFYGQSLFFVVEERRFEALALAHDGPEGAKQPTIDTSESSTPAEPLDV